jgi:signal transduction histidine kinase
MREVLREAHIPLELARSRIELKQALEEVAASRSRLLQTGDAERRRLERDLHDGAQQRLVAIGMMLRLAQQRADPSDAMQEAVGRAVGELQEAVRDLRRLANGVRPRSLDEGLSPAIRSLVRSCPVAVDVRIDADGVPDALVTTAYYVVAEGLTNALKHAEATRVLIEVERDDGRLRVSVADDGRGGAAVTPSSGLAGLRDRVAATGGDLTVASPEGRGTRVEAVLPCGS